MGKIYAMFNQKGGVGKTTTTANLCAGIASLGKRVLIVDFDAQSNLTSGLNINRKTLKASIYNVLTGELSAEQAIIPTSTENLFILPSNIDLAGAEVEMANVPRRETILKRALTGVGDNYDYVVIDCPPSLGMLSINSLVASDGVIIPIQCEYYALEGVSQLINTVNLVKKSLNAQLEVKGVILTMFDKRTNLSTQIVQEVRNYFGSKVFNSIIPRNVRVAEAPSHGMSIMQYDINSKGARAYMALAHEFIEKC
ncbi:MAG: ParA family protein [Eubacteriaceae bacterium]|nr:ParA family protein [Eubacteriaceae bacterium]